MEFLATLILAVFFSGVLFYLINYALIPYNSEQVLDVRNLTIVSVIAVLVLALVFAFIHLAIDKLFFCRFYERPKMALAYRRGFLFGVLLVGIAWLRIFGFWFWYIIALWVVFIGLIETLFTAWRIRMKKTSEEVHEDEESQAAEKKVRSEARKDTLEVKKDSVWKKLKHLIRRKKKSRVGSIPSA